MPAIYNMMNLPVGVLNAAINATCIKACRGYMVYLYTIKIDCCIRHSNGTRAGPDFAPCAGGVFLPSTGANTPLAHVVISTCCNLRWWCFFFHQLAHTLHLHTWWSSPIATCTGGVFLPNTSANTLLALCGGGSCIYMWWWWF